MNASHFLFNFDLPLSPHKPARNEKEKKKEREVRRGWGGVRGVIDGGRGRQKEQKRKREKWGAGGSTSFLLHISSLPHSFSSSASGSRNSAANPSATSNLQPVHLSRCRKKPFLFHLPHFFSPWTVNCRHGFSVERDDKEADWQRVVQSEEMENK